MRQNILIRLFIPVISLLIIVAGVAHFAAVPGHISHAPLQALFSVIAGLVQIAWAIAYWRQPSASRNAVGVVLNGALFTVWLVSQVLPSPFGDSPDRSGMIDLFIGASESLALPLLLAISVAQEDSLKPVKVFAPLVVALVFGIITYGAARAAEPFLPTFGTPGDGQEPDGAAPIESNLPVQAFLALDPDPFKPVAQAPTPIVVTPEVLPAATPTIAEPIPTQPPPTQPAIVTEQPEGTHTLQPGEYLYCIARRYNVHIDDLMSQNGLDSGARVAAGQELKIPDPARPFDGKLVLLPHPAEYKVIETDTIFAVACKFGDLDPNAIIQANALVPPYLLTPGQTLQIP